MASTRSQMKSIHRDNIRVADTTKRFPKVVKINNVSRCVPANGDSKSSLFSKLRKAVAPSSKAPSKVSRSEAVDASNASVPSRDVPAQERVKTSSYRKANDASPPSKIPRLAPSAELKRVSAFTKFKHAIGLSKIPHLKLKSRRNALGNPSPQHPMCRGDSYSVSPCGKSLSSAAAPVTPPKQRVGGAQLGARSLPAILVFSPVASPEPITNDVRIEALNPAATLVFPPVRPLNIVKKRSATLVQPDVLTSRPFTDDYPRPRQPVPSSAQQLQTIGLPADYSVAGPRYRAPWVHNVRQATVSTVNQSTQSDHVVNTFEPLSKLVSTSSGATPDGRRITFSKIKQSIRKSARSIFKPAPGRRQGPIPIQITIGRTTIESTHCAPSPVNVARKPSIIFPPAQKPFRPRGSLPPISGLLIPDKCQSAHGFCQLRRKGSASTLYCVCYKELMRTRQKFASYPFAILSDIVEYTAVPYFPTRRSFIMNAETRRLLDLDFSDDVDVVTELVPEVPELVDDTPIVSCSTLSIVEESVSGPVSSDLPLEQHLESTSFSPLDQSLENVASSGPISISSLNQTFENIASSPESVSLSVFDSSDNMSSTLDENLDNISLYASDDDHIMHETSLMDELLEFDSPSLYSLSSSLMDENMESLLHSPSYSFLDDYFDDKSVSLLSLDDTPVSTTPIEEPPANDLISPDNISVAMPENHCTSGTISGPSDDNIISEIKNPKTLKKANRSVQIHSASLGLGIDVGIKFDEIDYSKVLSPPAEHSPVLYGSNGSATTPSQTNTDSLSSGKAFTSPRSISSGDFVTTPKSHRTAVYRNRLSIEVVPAVSPSYRGTRSSPPPLPPRPSQPLYSVGALTRFNLQDEVRQRPAPRPKFAPPPIPMARHEDIIGAQHFSHRNTRRQAILLPVSGTPAAVRF